MRILALDWGMVRIGAAISDEEGKIAFALKKPLENKNVFEEIRKISTDSQVGLILLGLPKGLSGRETQSTKKLKTFADNLFTEVKIPVSLIDERYSTVQAHKLLTSQGLNEKKQRIIKDNIAAQIMLQQYLDNKNAQTKTHSVSAA